MLRNRELREAGFRPQQRCYCCGHSVGNNGRRIGEDSFFLPGHDSKFHAALLRGELSEPLMVKAIQAHLQSSIFD